ncbi:SMI1/KNR4 family protein [Saccharibacillus sp. O23]|uniref:SMI1/KNR4 family protein n=1 Tax=Saccharibacillus sp. O23 TaxID=2009338 RepID=UPI000B4E47EE|nr:SMI1/KNR4 family protein [Saccharibacillus sp. O23]OWR32304.1 SMI1/KNR4 family protein [Saccharibacillus sp. O23]
MKKKDIETLLMNKKLVNAPLAGCTEEEILKLEDRIGLKLPGIYKEFLSAAGRESGRLFQGTVVHYTNLLEIQTWAKELLEENQNPMTLSDTSFVFSMHQGYEIRFFDVDMGENPPVFLWYEGMEDPTSAIQLFDTFEEFLLQEIEEHSSISWRD